MIKKTLTFKDLDGEDVTEDFYFALNTAELAELEFSKKGGLSAHMEKVIKSEDGGEIIRTFKEIIRMSVGRRSEDGRRFEKSDEIANDFMQTNAYPDLFMALATDAESAAEFIRGIVPSDAAEAVANGQRAVTDIPLPEETKPAWFTEGRVPTEAELKGVKDPALLQEAFRRKSAQA